MLIKTTTSKYRQSTRYYNLRHGLHVLQRSESANYGPDPTHIDWDALIFLQKQVAKEIVIGIHVSEYWVRSLGGAAYVVWHLFGRIKGWPKALRYVYGRQDTAELAAQLLDYANDIGMFSANTRAALLEALMKSEP